eukprot:TRINITY_DN4316_c0_g1_i2.p1 TRINITY_DN4316_c0_g1~~TRINITY_DN4316_c0_g1_i2.p1  ORF type:complete len:188 (-),score=53.47 TRINITY_DN4316_c0_g1_i2:108-617(-)
MFWFICFSVVLFLVVNTILHFAHSPSKHHEHMSEEIKSNDDGREVEVKRISPLIESVVWGAIVVEGKGKGKDWKIFPNGAREWNWGETGTSHSPGIQIADIQELLDNGANFIVLSSGLEAVLQTKQETIDFLQRESIKFEILKTPKAVDTYNELAKKGMHVGGLFHSTC